MVELNWVVLTWSCRDIDEVSGVSSNCSPPGFFEVYQGNVPFSPFFYSIWHKGPVFSSCKVRHDEELGLNVMLPLNVSLDLGLGMVCNMT